MVYDFLHELYIKVIVPHLVRLVVAHIIIDRDPVSIVMDSALQITYVGRTRSGIRLETRAFQPLPHPLSANSFP